MSTATTTKKVPAQLTPEQRAERKREIQAARFNRDRARMLAHVQSCVQQAAAAISAGDVTLHDQWLDATGAALVSYRQFVALSLPKSTPADAVATPVMG